MESNNKLLETPISGRIKKRARDELLIGIVVIIFLVLITTIFEMDLVESFYDFSRVHEDWELDEIIFGFFWVAIVSVVYGIRRLIDIKALNQDISRSAYFDT